MADKSGNELESTEIAEIPELPINQKLLEESTSIKEHWKVVRDRLEKIETSKSQVNPTVYERVKADYHARLEEVTKELMDKKQAIDSELEGLYATRAKIAEQLESQRHALEELKFRNTLGEFTDDEYATKTKERQDTISKFETAINSVTANISRYESIFHEEAELLGVEAATPDMESSAASPDDEEESLPGDTGSVDISELSEATFEEPVEETAKEAAKEAVEEKAYEEESLKTDDEGYILNEMEGGYFAEGEEAPANEDSQTVRADVEKTPPKKTEHPRARVVIISGDQAGAAYPLKDTISLGRADSCTIVLKDAKTSRQHAQIQQHGNEFIIVDLSSSNGTFVNGQRIEEHVLQNNDEVQIGDYILQFQE